jgi:hypothetical protein
MVPFFNSIVTVSFASFMRKRTNFILRRDNPVAQAQERVRVSAGSEYATGAHPNGQARLTAILRALS